MDLDSGHAWMHGCRNAGMLIKSSVRHRYSGIMVSPVSLVTD
jgi:hypothetical protein